MLSRKRAQAGPFVTASTTSRATAVWAALNCDVYDRPPSSCSDSQKVLASSTR